MSQVLGPTNADDPTFRKIVAAFAKNEPDDAAVIRQTIAEVERDEGRTLKPIARWAVATVAKMILWKFRYDERKEFFPQPRECGRGSNMIEPLAALAVNRPKPNVLRALGIDKMNGIEIRRHRAAFDQHLGRELVHRLVIEKAVRLTPASKKAHVEDYFPVKEANEFYEKTAKRVGGMKKPVSLPSLKD